MKEPNTKIAVTLYNLRDYCKTEKDLDDTLGKVKAIGYEAVQVSGLGPIEPVIVKNLLDKHGLYCCATHESLDVYENNFDEVVEKMRILECGFTALGSPGDDFWSEKGTKNLAARLEIIGDKFTKENIIFGYHNHDKEFNKFTKKTFLEELYENTSTNVFAELDVYWIQKGGADPASWIRKMEGRTSVIHFKDYSLKLNEDYTAVSEFSEIGEGNLNWHEILLACIETNVRWYVVEQDSIRGNKDIFESIKISFDNMKSMGIK